MSKYKAKLILLASFFFLFSAVEAQAVNNDYPRLANYYLSYVSSRDYDQLSRWDLLIVPTETAFSSPGFFSHYRARNPEGMIFSYIYPAMVNTSGLNDSVGLNRYIYNQVDRNNWWLRDSQGGKVEIWPNIYAVNMYNSSWRNFNVNYIKNKINLGFWDGIFFDIVDSSISHYSPGKGIDIDGDGRAESESEVNQKWCQGCAQLFNQTRQAVGGGKKIIINGNSLPEFQGDINGRMFETFPTPWEGDGSWSTVMRQYLQVLPQQNQKPLIYVINSNTENTGDYRNYQKMRFGLTSTLLGEGYFSFDHGDESHAQLWWYDEYEQNLGAPQGEPYNLLDKNNSTIKSGLWRRDFENGISLVNSTNREQNYYFSREVFDKIQGTQDRRVNNGARINWVKLEPKDGIILLKENNEIKENSFNNGSFVRVFNKEGKQTRNGFFAYMDRFAGSYDILISDIDNNPANEETLVNGDGIIRIYQEGREIANFEPYDQRFRGEVSFAISDLNGDGTKEIITGAGAGGGPHVRIFNKEGKPLTGGFFAYNPYFRGGVDVAVMDLNGDGTKEIITGAGSGGGPHVRVFSKDGQPLTGGFFAFEDNYSGGVSVSVGNIDGLGEREIIVGAGSGDRPVVKIFSKDGNFLKEFRAYEGELDYGIKVMSYDLNRDGQDEILASTISF